MSSRKNATDESVRSRNTKASGRRGRPSELTDDQLHSRRDQLVQVFEGMWSEIGWGLQTCKKPDGLIRVFKPLTQTFAENLVSVFCGRKGRFDSRTTLGKNRKEWRSLVEQSRTAEASMQRSHEQLQRLDAALAQASPRQRKSISTERKKWSHEADRTAQEARRARDAEREQWSRLQHLEASFAREELFQFLKSGRYSIEPFSLANAVAGLPYMGLATVHEALPTHAAIRRQSVHSC